MAREQIRQLDALAARAWRAAVVEPLDGWELRFNDGVTRRANSVYANEAGDRPLEEKLAAVEAFYARRGSPARYQISPAVQPTDLDAVLERRGYAHVAPTAVQVGAAAGILARLRANPTVTVRTTPGFDEVWFEMFCRAERVACERETVGRRGILRRIAADACFALATVEGRPVGVGLGAAEGDWFGVFNMAVEPEHRRRGVASTILRALADWAARRGAGSVYLQVMEDNAPALALYARAGLTTLYGYHYREIRRESFGAGGECKLES